MSERSQAQVALETTTEENPSEHCVSSNSSLALVPSSTEFKSEDIKTEDTTALVDDDGGVLSKCLEKLGSQLAVLEMELRYAWKALDLLSQEYVVMWNRMEKAESLLSEQQGIIHTMMEKERESMEDLYQEKKVCKAEDAGNLGDEDEESEMEIDRGEIPDELSKLVSAAVAEGGRLGQSVNARFPDEAFYRSLNVVHRESDDTVLEAEKELSLIWEEDADSIDKGSSSSPPPPAVAVSVKICDEQNPLDTEDDDSDVMRTDSKISGADRSISGEPSIFSAADYTAYKHPNIGSSYCASSSTEEKVDPELCTATSNKSSPQIPKVSSSSSSSSNSTVVDSGAVVTTGIGISSSILGSPIRRAVGTIPRSKQRTRPRSSLEESLRLLYSDEADAFATSDEPQMEGAHSSLSSPGHKTESVSERLGLSNVSSKSPTPYSTSELSLLSRARSPTPSRPTSTLYDEYEMNKELDEALRIASGAASPLKVSSSSPLSPHRGGLTLSSSSIHEDSRPRSPWSHGTKKPEDPNLTAFLPPSVINSHPTSPATTLMDRQPSPLRYTRSRSPYEPPESPRLYEPASPRRLTSPRHTISSPLPHDKVLPENILLSQRYEEELRLAEVSRHDSIVEAALARSPRASPLPHVRSPLNDLSASKKLPPGSIDTNLNVGDEINIRVSPGLVTKSSLQHARSDSGVSELSWWSSVEKSPTSPSRSHFTQSKTAMISSETLARSEFILTSTSGVDASNALPDVTMSSVSTELRNLTSSLNDRTVLQQTSLREEEFSVLSGSTKDLSGTPNYLRPSSPGSTTTRHSGGSSRSAADAKDSSSIYDVRTDMDFLRQDLAAMAKAREKERDLINGAARSSTSPGKHNTPSIGLDSLYKGSSGYTNASSYRNEIGAIGSPYLGKHDRSVESASAELKNISSYYYNHQPHHHLNQRDILNRSKSSRSSFPGSDSDDSTSNAASYGGSPYSSLHLKNRPIHPYSRTDVSSGPYSPYSTSGALPPHLEQRYMAPYEAMYGIMDKGSGRDTKGSCYYHGGRNIVNPPSAGYAGDKYACYENPSYMVTEPGELKWSDKRERESDELTRSQEGPLASSYGMLRFDRKEGGSDYYRQTQSLGHHRPYGEQWEKISRHSPNLRKEYIGVGPENYPIASPSSTTSTLPYASPTTGGVDEDSEVLMALGKRRGEEYDASGNSSTRSSGRKSKSKKAIKSAMNTVGSWIQQDLHLSLPRTKRTNSIPTDEQPDIQKHYSRSSSVVGSAECTPQHSLKKKKRQSMVLVANISGFISKAKKWSSQSEDSDENDSRHDGKFHRPNFVKNITSRKSSRSGRSYEASESDLSEGNRLSSSRNRARRTMSEGSGGDTDLDFERLPDLAQGLFPTIGEAKKSAIKESIGEPRKSSLDHGRSNEDSSKMPTSPKGAEASLSSGHPMEFAASRAVGIYRQMQAAGGNDTYVEKIESSPSHISRSDSLPRPPRPPPPRQGSFNLGLLNDSYNNESVQKTKSDPNKVIGDETGIMESREGEQLIGTPPSQQAATTGHDETRVYEDAGNEKDYYSKKDSQPLSDTAHKSKTTISGSTVTSSPPTSYDSSTTFTSNATIASPPQVMLITDADAVDADQENLNSTKILPINQNGSTFICSPGGSPYSTSPSPGGISRNNKSIGDSDMGSSSESGPRVNNKIRLDLPSQRTLSEEEDTRSTHSFRSSRVSSRRQSTEESIDSEDEWYKYELRKLEELERQQIAAIEYQPASTGAHNGNAAQQEYNNLQHVENGATIAYRTIDGYPVYAYGGIPTAATVDMKERMGLVLQELVLKAAPKIQSESNVEILHSVTGKVTESVQSENKTEPLVNPPAPLERRLSFTREESLQDEPLGYVSRRRINSHDEPDPTEFVDQNSIWKISEQQQKQQRGGDSSPEYYGSMIEPPPVEIGLRIGMAIESNKKQQQQLQQGYYHQHQDSASLRSSESAFYSGGSGDFPQSSSRGTGTLDERPSISLPSSSSLGDAVGLESKDDDSRSKKSPTEDTNDIDVQSGDSGETSGPDTPEPDEDDLSFDEDDKHHMTMNEQRGSKHSEMDEEGEIEAEEREKEYMGEQLRLAEERERLQEQEEMRKREEEEQMRKREEQEDREKMEEELIRQETEAMRREEEENIRLEFEEKEKAEQALLAQQQNTNSNATVPESQTPVQQLSRRESTISATFAMPKKFMDMISVSELKKLGSLGSGGGGSASNISAEERRKSIAPSEGPESICSAAIPEQGEEQNEYNNNDGCYEETGESSNHRNDTSGNRGVSRISAISVSVDDEMMDDGKGGLGSKWSFLKTLKEKKAEQKENADVVAALIKHDIVSSLWVWNEKLVL